MSLPRILQIAHNHPSLHPGGTEIFAHGLFGALKAAGAPSMFLACTNQVHREQKPGTNLQTLGRSADEVILWAGHFDRFYQSQIDLHGVVPDLTNLLLSFRPDVVHVHHVLLLGAEMLFLIRRVLPRARIVYTLHDYYPICANDGQMVTTREHALCSRASPDACHRCFPEIGADKFVLREKHLKSLFSLVDRFVAPSRFLRDRYVAWGLPADRIEVLPNGQAEEAPAPHRPVPAAGRRDAFGFFGNLNPFKGVTVALDAARRLVEAGDDAFTLAVHGGALYQTDGFRDQVAAALAATQGRATARGAYRREEMASLMGGVDWVIVPSIWWENAPLVIQEAFRHRRPVICSGIGGMAEAVRDGVDGLHFRAGDAADLARVMTRAMTEPGLWERLAASAPAVPGIAEAADRYLALYQDLGAHADAVAGSANRSIAS